MMNNLTRFYILLTLPIMISMSGCSNIFDKNDSSLLKNKDTQIEQFNENNKTSNNIVVLNKINMNKVMPKIIESKNIGEYNSLDNSEAKNFGFQNIWKEKNADIEILTNDNETILIFDNSTVEIEFMADALDFVLKKMTLDENNNKTPKELFLEMEPWDVNNGISKNISYGNINVEFIAMNNNQKLLYELPSLTNTSIIRIRNEETGNEFPSSMESVGLTLIRYAHQNNSMQNGVPMIATEFAKNNKNNILLLPNEEIDNANPDALNVLKNISQKENKQ